MPLMPHIDTRAADRGRRSAKRNAQSAGFCRFLLPLSVLLRHRMMVTNVMAINAVHAKAQPATRRGRLGTRQWIILAIALLLGGSATLWYDWYYGRLGLLAPQPIVESNSADGHIIRVPPAR